MLGRMSGRMIVALAVLLVAPFAGVVRAQEAKVVVELLPERSRSNRTVSWTGSR